MKKYIFMFVAGFVLLAVVFIAFFLRKQFDPYEVNEEKAQIVLSTAFNLNKEKISIIRSVFSPKFISPKSYYIFEVNQDYVDEFLGSNDLKYIGKSELNLRISGEIRELFNDLRYIDDKQYDFYQDNYSAELYVLNEYGMFLYIR